MRQGPLARALEALNGGGEETRLVGGAVRDLALGEPAVDFDLTTTATTDEVIRRAREAGFKVALTGVAHGTVTVVVEGRPIETTTLREDVETDGRWAKVAFGRDFAADARRRDFTINALSLSADGTVHDYVGGLEDLAAGRVRFIGEAEARIREDYLRILRFFRFSARFAANGLDREGLSAAIRARDGLARLSRERVRAELMKLLVAPRASEVVRAMGESGFLEPILGGVGYTRRLSRLIAIEAERGAGGDARPASGRAWRRDPGRRGTAARAAAARQRRSRPAEIRRRGADRPARDRRRRYRSTACARSCSRAGREAARDALILAQAESEAPPSDAAFAAADRFLADAPEPKLPVSGADLIARGVAAGRPSDGRCAPSRRCGSGRVSRRSRRRWPACSRRRSRNRRARIRQKPATTGVPERPRSRIRVRQNGPRGLKYNWRRAASK